MLISQSFGVSRQSWRLVGRFGGVPCQPTLSPLWLHGLDGVTMQEGAADGLAKEIRWIGRVGGPDFHNSHLVPVTTGLDPKTVTNNNGNSKTSLHTPIEITGAVSSCVCCLNPLHTLETRSSLLH
jgi:hypothetical protein